MFIYLFIVCHKDNLHVKDVVKVTKQQQDFRSSPPTPDEVQWSYTDPQGKIQGKLMTFSISQLSYH